MHGSSVPMLSVMRCGQFPSGCCRRSTTSIRIFENVKAATFGECRQIFVALVAVIAAAHEPQCANNQFRNLFQ